MALSKRHLSFTFELAQGTFGRSGGNAVTLENYRASVNIALDGSNFSKSANFRIWGVPLSIMNRLTVLSIYSLPEMANNLVAISAGDDIGGSAVCFEGTIAQAWVDASGQPDVCLYVSAFESGVQLSKPVPPTSYLGSVDAGTMLSGLASQAGLKFENNGVEGTLVDPYKPGDIKAQIASVCRDLDCSHTIDNGALAVWPRGGSREGSSIKVSAKTGMVGYPAFSESGCRFRTLYNPNLAFGRTIEVESELDAANGQWFVQNISHSLDSEIPGGQWFSDLDCGLVGYTAPILGKG